MMRIEDEKKHDVFNVNTLHIIFFCRYYMMTRCWGAKPTGRPSFKEIVCDVESLLSQEAEYIEFNTYQEEKYNVLENNSDERV